MVDQRSDPPATPHSDANAGRPPAILVVGGASLDILHFAGRSERSGGGAGLYTSLAAHRAGARVTMIGPRPVPMPAELAETDQRLTWIGMEVPPERLPSFEIAHLGGGVTEMRNFWWRAESQLTLQEIPADLGPMDLVYVIALADPARQLEFLTHFRARGRRVGCGTFADIVAESPHLVRRSFEAADVFFCNEAEAESLFGSLEAARAAPGRILFITRGARGATVVQGNHPTHVGGVAVQELDPTGAGDTFCGTVLARLARGEHPVEAARAGVAAAAEMVTAVGPDALWRSTPPPPAPVDPRVTVDRSRVRSVAEILAAAPEVAPFPFTGPPFPIVSDPGTLDYFCAATLQQFGFWTVSSGRYEGPVFGRMDGHDLKGSDFLWAVYARWLADDPQGLSAAAQAEITDAEMERRLASEEGGSPLADAPLRAGLARSYGRDMKTLEGSAAELVARVTGSRRPLTKLLERLDRIGGYKEDPLRKKSALLAVILRQRPESFLPAGDDEAPPIVDYHIQRSCLRTGLVEVVDPTLRQRLEERRLLDPKDEEAVRRAAWDAILEVQIASGRSMGAVDWFFFQNRSRCPEMTEPRCDECPVDPVCAHSKELFQPVLRTTFY